MKYKIEIWQHHHITEIYENEDINDNLILVQEPFLLDDELRERVNRWVEWANKVDPKEYDPFA